MRQPGRQAPDGREPVRLADLLLHALDVGQVLERAGRPAPAPQEREAHPHRKPGPVGPDELGLRAGAGWRRLPCPPGPSGTAARREQGLPAHAAQLDLAPRAQRLGRPVHRDDGAPAVERQEPARDALDDVLVERAQGGQAGLAPMRLAARLAQAARQVRAEVGHEEARAEVRADEEDREAAFHPHVARDGEVHGGRQPSVELGAEGDPVQEHRHGGHAEALAGRHHDAGGQDRDQIEEREDAVRARP